MKCSGVQRMNIMKQAPKKTKGRDAIQQGRRMFEILSRMFPPFLPLFNSVVYELDLSRSWLSSSHLT